MRRSSASFSASSRGMRAFSLVSMLVGLALGVLAGIVAFMTFRIASVAYRDIVGHVMVEERGHRALAVLAHAIRHAGHVTPVTSSVTSSVTLPAGEDGRRDGDTAASPMGFGAAQFATPPAPIVGHDDCGVMLADNACARAGVERSDALRVRLSGSGRPDDPTLPDGTMSDCGGYALPARAESSPHESAAVQRYARNVFYIGRATDGVPQLMCRYPVHRDGRISGTRYTRGALVRGVETMQFRYGLDADDDGVIEDFVRADEVHALGASAWHAVRAVRIALVMRGERLGRVAGRNPEGLDSGARHTLTLFDPAVSADDRFTPSRHLDRRRHVFTTIVRLRNASSCREAAC
ncbi:PilW family protein [Cupriavidus plantarum]|uniref:PilW family protein n=1 Tax=Cupriavidus plantarum TaxID=942865 RepID=UPI001BA5E929|nr:PilW family protein [Cupriavidus plantarum]